MKSFKLYGQLFTPVRKLTEAEQILGIGLPLRSTGISNYDNFSNHISSEWNYEKFYEKAKKVGAGEIDVFLMNKKITVVPGTNELFELKEDSQLLKKWNYQNIYYAKHWN